jgi:hypothetical protein
VPKNVKLSMRLSVGDCRWIRDYHRVSLHRKPFPYNARISLQRLIMAVNYAYIMSRRQVLTMEKSLQELPASSAAAETWAKEFSNQLVRLLYYRVSLHAYSDMRRK